MEGLDVTTFRKMTSEEYEKLAWHPDNIRETTVIELSDGSMIFPSRDPEGNGPGAFWGLPDDASDIVTSLEITAVAPMSKQALQSRGWPVGNPHIPAPPVLTLSSGDQIYPAQDSEGNGPGVIFGIEPSDDGSNDEPDDNGIDLETATTFILSVE